MTERISSTKVPARPQKPEEVASSCILVVDTDEGVRWALSKGLARTGYTVRTALTVGEALHIANTEPVEAILLELLPEAGLSLEVMEDLMAAPSKPRIICMSVDARPQTVIDCMRRGAVEFLVKPFSLTEARAGLKKTLGTDRFSTATRPTLAKNSHRVIPSSEGSFLVGISPATKELRRTIEQIAKTDLNCFIRGQSGTGKDLVAREIHRMSPKRNDRPFIKVNCSALPAPLLESELFGYEKGAFTGAVTSKPGRFELASKGIIFLDEIGDIDPMLQAKLLQVIEHKEFTKLGGTKQITVDVQIVAATNADIEGKIKEGTFRDDLNYRLEEMTIWVPPLSQRREDVPLLVRHFIEKHSENSGVAPREMAGRDLADLCNRPWLGNVRELESTIKRWVVLGNQALDSSSASNGMANVGPKPYPTAEAIKEEGPADDFLLSQNPEEVLDDPQLLLEALDLYQWNRRRTAEALQVSYQTLRRRMQRFKLHEPN